MVEIRVPDFAVKPTRQTKGRVTVREVDGEVRFDVRFDASDGGTFSQEEFLKSFRPDGAHAKTVCSMMGLEFPVTKRSKPTEGEEPGGEQESA